MTKRKPLEYEQLNQIRQEHGLDAVCGYLRDPVNRQCGISGFCYIREDLGENPTCTSILPMIREIDCKYYKEWMNGDY